MDPGRICRIKLEILTQLWLPDPSTPLFPNLLASNCGKKTSRARGRKKNEILMPRGATLPNLEVAFCAVPKHQVSQAEVTIRNKIVSSVLQPASGRDW